MLRGQWNRLWWSALLLAGLLQVRTVWSEDAARRIHAGDPMPAFSLADAAGKTFTYDPQRAPALGLVIMKVGQEHFARIVTDLKTVAEELRSSGRPFDCVGVVSGPGSREFVLAQDAKGSGHFPLLLDPDFVLWGKLAIIAAPTAVVVGADHKVRWTEAGYGYDFIPAFHSQLGKAIGLKGSADASVRVETLQNASDRARVDRHVQMGRMLAQRGRLPSAIEELRKALALDPNAVGAVIELGELLCQAGQSQAALDIVATAESKVKGDRWMARFLQVSGWARRQMGQLDAAETLLTKATGLDPSLARTFYELGKVYQEKGDDDKALACYRKALARVFGETEKPAAFQP